MSGSTETCQITATLMSGGMTASTMDRQPTYNGKAKVILSRSTHAVSVCSARVPAHLNDARAQGTYHRTIGITILGAI